MSQMDFWIGYFAGVVTVAVAVAALVFGRSGRGRHE